MDLENTFCGFKFFNVFGPNEYHKGSMSSMIYKSYYQIKENGVVKLFKSNSPDFGDGEQLRDFIYVKDVCKVMLEAYDKNLKGIYNLGTGNTSNWNELAENVFKALDKESNIKYIEIPNDIANQYQNYTKAEMTKYHNAGFKTEFTSFENSVSDYVINYLEKNNKYI